MAGVFLVREITFGSVVGIEVDFPAVVALKGEAETESEWLVKSAIVSVRLVRGGENGVEKVFGRGVVEVRGRRQVAPKRSVCLAPMG